MTEKRCVNVRRTRRIDVRMSQNDLYMLYNLARRSGKNRSELVRYLIAKEYEKGDIS